jgi:hypothetical protein
MPISEFKFCHKTGFLYCENIKIKNAQNKINKNIKNTDILKQQNKINKNQK